tara:strand:+ start:65 stop:1885 length:1821 start_codon:yes stop_codon:yes gene_type:complete
MAEKVKEIFFKILICALASLLLSACAGEKKLPESEIDKPSAENNQTEIGPGGRPVGPAWSRSPVYARNGMAATAQPLATQIAIDILKSGGTAVDAAIAANAALGLMEPTGNGIGGDLFAMVWDPEAEELAGLNASGRSPKSRSFEQLLKELDGSDKIPPLGHLPVTVPGAVDGWFELHERYGRLPMDEILGPAIDYAENGFPVSPVIAFYFARAERSFMSRLDQINEFENARAVFFSPEAPKVGEIFKNPDLANTYRALVDGGRDAFYKGEIARTVDKYMRRIGGDLVFADLSSHTSSWVTPACVDYRTVELCELPPNGQGFAALQMVNILKNVDLRQWSRNHPKVWHYLTEAKRLAFEDLARYYGDPDFSDMPTERLLSEAYGKKRFNLIDPEKSLTDPSPGSFEFEGEGDTTFLTVADRDGMMVSLIQSNYRGMGSGLVPDGLGFMLQDRGELFSLEPGHPNVYKPGKRPFHTIIPAFILQNERPLVSFGLMGGSMQPQGHVQILINLIDYGMNLQEAGDAARMNHLGGRQPTGSGNENLQGVLHLEPGVSDASIERLREMGHQVKIVDDGVMFGGYQAIYRNPSTGIYVGATEMRKDGQASGY